MLARKGERILFTNDLAFSYFVGDESEQFSFVKVPKLFFTDSRFEELSYGAKILYGLLLDRMSLSRKNKWFDESKRVYVIYTIDNITEDFRVSKTVAVRFMQELENFGLIEKKRRPNLAALIYVKNFILSNEGEEMLSDKMPETQGSPESGSLEYGSPENRIPEVQNLEVQNMEFQKEAKIQGSLESGSPENGIPEFHNMESNKTNIDDDVNYISSSSNNSRENDVVKTIQSKINYEKIIASCQYDSEIVELVVHCLANLFLLSKESYKIDNVKIPAEKVQQTVNDKLSERSFRQVLDNISANGAGTIYNMQNYVIICFYKLQTVPKGSAKGQRDPFSFNGFQQHDYDFEELEKELLKIR